MVLIRLLYFSYVLSENIDFEARRPFSERRSAAETRAKTIDSLSGPGAYDTTTTVFCVFRDTSRRPSSFLRQTTAKTPKNENRVSCIAATVHHQMYDGVVWRPGRTGLVFGSISRRRYVFEKYRFRARCTLLTRVDTSGTKKNPKSVGQTVLRTLFSPKTLMCSELNMPTLRTLYVESKTVLGRAED